MSQRKVGRVSDPAAAAAVDGRLNRYAVPFAKALAVFVNELNKGADVAVAVERRSSSRTSAAGRGTPAPAEMDTKMAVEFTPELVMQTVGNRLRAVTHERGWSQKRLAEEAGMDPAMISRVFKHPEKSQVSTLRKIADVLGVDLRDVI